MVSNFHSTSLQASIFSRFRQKLSDQIFTEWSLILIPDRFLTPNFVVYGQKTWGTWHFGFFRTVSFKYLEIPGWGSIGSRCKYFTVELPLLSAFHAMTSLATSLCYPHQHFSASSRSVYSFTLPQQSIRLSYLSLKPKWSDRNHQSVRWRASGLWQPNSPVSNNFSSSSFVSSRHAFGLFPRPCFTRFFRLAANTSLERLNTSSWRILKGSFNSFRRR